MSWDPLAPKKDLFLSHNWAKMKDLLTLSLPYLCQSSLFLRRLCFSCDKKLSQITQDLEKGTQYICICSIYKEYRDLLLIYLQIIFIFLLPKRKNKKKKKQMKGNKVKKYRDGKRGNKGIRRWNIKTYGFSHKSTSMTFIFGFFFVFTKQGEWMSYGTMLKEISF